MNILEIISESKSRQYRFYKKSRDTYRIEQRDGGGWKEIHEDETISKLTGFDCSMVVDESGRQNTLDNTGQSAKDVAVHAWIECDDYELHKQMGGSDGTLYYNPYTVTKFVDRDSFESKDPVVIETAEAVSTNGNNLVYSGAEDTYRDKNTQDDNMHLLQKKEGLEVECGCSGEVED